MDRQRPQRPQPAHAVDAVMPKGITLINPEAPGKFFLLKDDGTEEHPTPPGIFVTGKVRGLHGTTEIHTMLPEGVTYEQYIASKKPVLWLVHGLGGNATQAHALMAEIAKGEYMVRAISLPGHGSLPGKEKDTFPNTPGLRGIIERTFGLYPENIRDLMETFHGEPKVLFLHSAAAWWGQRFWLSRLAHKAIHGVIFDAPVASNGTGHSAIEHTSRIDNWPAMRACLRQFKFWGKHRFLESALRDDPEGCRRVLLSGSRKSNDHFVKAYMAGLDRVSNMDYLKTLIVSFSSLWGARFKPKDTSIGGNFRVLLSHGSDSNYTDKQHKKTADEWICNYVSIPGLPHEGAALASDRQVLAGRIVDILDKPPTSIEVPSAERTPPRQFPDPFEVPAVT